MSIQIKNVLDPAEKEDGFRVMVDETLPDGIDEYKARIDMWPKEIVPSRRLSEFLSNNPKMWDTFEERYMKELDTDKDLWVNMIVDRAREGTVTLLYCNGTAGRNNAVVVRNYILASREEFLLKMAA